MTDSHPKSPCIGVCGLNSADLCSGCYRTAVEIADWSMANRTHKLEILRRVSERRRAAIKVQLD